MFVEFQLGDLHLIAGTHRRSVCGDGAIEHLGLQRLAHTDMETFFARGQGLDGLGKFTRDIADQGKLRIFLERAVLRRWGGIRLGLALGLRVVWRCTGVREEGNLFVRRKAGRRVRGRTKAVDPRDVRVSQKQKRQRNGKPIRHKQCKPRPSWGPRSLFYDATKPLNRCLAWRRTLLTYLYSF